MEPVGSTLWDCVEVGSTYRLRPSFIMRSAMAWSLYPFSRIVIIMSSSESSSAETFLLKSGKVCLPLRRRPNLPYVRAFGAGEEARFDSSIKRKESDSSTRVRMAERS
jgi:hypothetical protein